jgi:hypothetical protein
MSVSHARLKPNRSGANGPEGPSRFAAWKKKGPLDHRQG